MQSIAAVAPYVLSISGASFVTAVLVQVLVKPLLNLVIKPDNPNQNSAVRGMVYVTALAVVLVSQFLHYQLSTRADVSTALGAAFAVAAIAIGAYHVLTSDTIPTIPLGTFTSLTPIHGEEPIPAPEPLAPAEQTPAVPTA